MSLVSTLATFSIFQILYSTQRSSKRGDRYYLNPKCPSCGHEEEDYYYYAPTSGFLTHECEQCHKIIDLEKLSGIDAESTATTSYGIKAIKEMKSRQ